MANNETHPLLQILKSFNQGDMILAFCLSVLVGLLLGALVYVLLTWASRRKATAMITRRSKKKRSGTSQTATSNQLGLYRSTFLNVYRQPSLEPVGPLGSKPGVESSTFRPVAKRSRAGLEMGEDTLMPDADDTAASSDSASLVPNKRHSFWLGNNGLKGFLPSQTPPPAYDSVIHAFEETCT
ncbi:myc target protein 1 homolog [Sebastes fasciatus]|uniref:myc target protein 1 homolog n=1 Tax=Sebastes fasciatus TaxID=394691 RepID=UPI003D9DB9CC